MSTTLDQLEAKAARAAAQHQAALQAAAQARQQADAERDDRLRAHDRRLLDAYDDEALGRDVREAQHALDEAVKTDPLGAAWVRLKVAQLRHAALAAEALTIANQLGIARTVCHVPPTRRCSRNWAEPSTGWLRLSTATR